MIKKITEHRGQVLHLSNETVPGGITWFDFAEEIFKMTERHTVVIPCTTDEYKTKAVRPKYSKLQNNSSIKMRNWKEGLEEYIRQIEK